MVNVLFASESGKSENFASIVKSTLDCLFQVQVICYFYSLLDDFYMEIVAGEMHGRLWRR